MTPKPEQFVRQVPVGYLSEIETEKLRTMADAGEFSRGQMLYWCRTAGNLALRAFDRGLLPDAQRLFALATHLCEKANES